MTIITTDIDLFQEVAKLPYEVIALIVSYLPKCILPQLLYFQPIQRKWLLQFCQMLMLPRAFIDTRVVIHPMLATRM